MKTNTIFRSVAVASLTFHAMAGPAEFVHNGVTVGMKANEGSKAAAFDYANSVPLRLPRAPLQALPHITFNLNGPPNPSKVGLQPGASPGKTGNGQEDPVLLPTTLQPSSVEIAPSEFGSGAIPFSTARNDSPKSTNKSYPSRAAGKLFFNTPSGPKVCSASLIKRGLIVTAAHCVAQFGSNQFYSGFQFVPGFRNGVAPYGIWNWTKVYAVASYLNGTDPCTPEASGVQCENDVAVIIVATKDNRYPGTKTGWYGYGYDGYGFIAEYTTHITQIGYPVCLDNGLIQQRNDSMGFVGDEAPNNTLIGSLMCGGSSGGPWLVNFGMRPVLTGTTSGAGDLQNVVVGVTSWGPVDLTIKYQGASPFTSGNIKVLVDTACAATPSACK